LGEKKGWYKVRANGQVGYVLASLVSAQADRQTSRLKTTLPIKATKAQEARAVTSRPQRPFAARLFRLQRFPHQHWQHKQQSPKKSDEPPPFVP